MGTEIFEGLIIKCILSLMKYVQFYSYEKRHHTKIKQGMNNFVNAGYKP